MRDEASSRTCGGGENRSLVNQSGCGSGSTLHRRTVSILSLGRRIGQLLGHILPIRQDGCILNTCGVEGQVWAFKDEQGH